MSGTNRLEALQTEGKAAFDRLGLPSRKLEAWHYTDLSQSDAPQFPLAEPGASGQTGAGVLHLVNGFLFAAGALPAGVTLERLETSEAGQAMVGHVLPSADLPLASLNAGLFSDGLVLRIAKGHHIETPLRLLSEARTESPLQFHGRLLLLIEEGASATLIETHLGQGRYFSNSVLEIDLQENAALHHVLLQDESLSAIHVGTVGLMMAARSTYRGVLLQLGGKLVRHEVHAVLAGSGADFALDGASVVLAQQHIDNTTEITHRAPGCPSRQLFKTVLDGEGHGVFQGTLLVERAAQKTNAHQLSRALMLSDRAEMDNKPGLEIYADDVKCGHGATIGDIDEQQLFYMRARGISETTARRMLIEAFLVEILEQIPLEPLRDGLTALLRDRLTALEAA